MLRSHHIAHLVSLDGTVGYSGTGLDNDLLQRMYLSLKIGLQTHSYKTQCTLKAVSYTVCLTLTLGKYIKQVQTYKATQPYSQLSLY